MQTSIIPFRIVVGGHSVDGYDVRAGAAGREAESVLNLGELPDDQAELGQVLGAALFSGSIHRLLLDTAQGADVSGARLQIQLQVTAPELAVLPWEWATLGQRTLWQPALRDDYPLVRIGRRPRPLPPLDLNGPLRLLIVCAPGADGAIAELGHALAGPVRAGTLVADLLRDASPSDLAAALAEEPCHLLHIIAPIGHSAYDATPRLQLARNLDPAGLAALLADYPDLRMCSFSGGGEPAATSHFAGLLHEYHGMATLALGGLDNPTNALFCSVVYGELAAGELAELAVTNGRIALANSGAGWGLPQLWMAAGGEQLFTLHPLPAEPDISLAQPTLIDRVNRNRRSREERKQRSRNAQGPRSRVGIPWEPMVQRIGAVFERHSKSFTIAKTIVAPRPAGSPKNHSNARSSACGSLS
ncbi:MAG: polysaccharide deacetylase [Oscillochloris sp.]|nr:polysaccharide deacetylase [Oscillochloris sp.]